jgi:predicted amidohydrolase
MSSLSFTIIQTNLFWEDKPANLKMLEEKILSIDKTEIVVLPEMFSTGFTLNAKNLAEPMTGETVAWMKKIASQKKIILTGSIIIEEDGKYYNRLIWALPNNQLGFYDKRHRFRFAGEDLSYTSGNKRFIAAVNGWKINLQICYDLRFPVWARQSPLRLLERGTEGEAEYDVLIYVANWPKARIHHWKTLLTARAIENQCFVIGVNRVGEDGNKVIYTGNSMVVNAAGKTLYLKENDEDIFTVTLEKDDLLAVRNKFPFWKDADAFKILNGH